MITGEKRLPLSFKEKHIKEYLDNVDEVFKIIRKAIHNRNLYRLLKGPVTHKGFKRLA